ncbi:TraB/GumN family protein [Phenylobacterium sp. VNQ135]|uniref:TraB/GumN family protein n=1 Tax=Phenylobacterium sp. VNQ135 TaxID=3400922 RepID=UPI003BFDDDD0
MRRVAGFAAAFILGVGAAGAAGAAPALWKISDANSEIYLFGTLHALSPAAKWRTPAYDAAYARADTVWFEADMGQLEPTRIMGILQRYGVDPEKPLSQKLAPADVAVLARQADLSRIDHLRPWAAAMMLTMQPVTGRGATLEAGADLSMTRATLSGGKRLRAFESLEDQARMFASLPETSEVQYLTEVIRERAAPRNPLAALWPKPDLESAWLAGDLARLGPGLVGEMKTENPAFYEALLKRRNQAWAGQLADAMAGSGVELVNVGALHLVGEDGLPALMTARGFTVTRVQ